MKKLKHITSMIFLCLLSLSAWLLPTQDSVACSTHNHLCSYHALGTPRTDYDVSNDETRLVIIAKATETSHGASRTDFDNHVLLPKETTSFDVFGISNTESTEPFIFRKTSYGNNNISDVGQWETADTQGRHVYASQYQVIYNNNTAQAIHSGDLNGGEKGRTPYQSGCPAYEGRANCEAIIITGNVPTGTYSQVVQMFNHHNEENPKANLILGAWTTGNGVLIGNSHLDGNTEASVKQINETVNNGTSETYNATVLEGNKSQTAQYNYYFYNRGFKPHAIGTTSWNHNKQYHTRYGNEYEVFNHKTGFIDLKQNVYTRTSIDKTTVNHLGNAQSARFWSGEYRRVLNTGNVKCYNGSTSGVRCDQENVVRLNRDGSLTPEAVALTKKKKLEAYEQQKLACTLNPTKCRNEFLTFVGLPTKEKRTLIGPVQNKKVKIRYNYKEKPLNEEEKQAWRDLLENGEEHMISSELGEILYGKLKTPEQKRKDEIWENYRRQMNAEIKRYNQKMKGPTELMAKFGSAGPSVASKFSKITGKILGNGNVTKTTNVLEKSSNNNTIVITNSSTKRLTQGRTAGEVRNSPGTVFSSNNLSTLKVGESLFKGENYAPVPKQIADKLSGRKFSNFRSFRSAFWKEMAKDPAVARNFNSQNLSNMRKGNAPFAILSQQKGKNKTYELDHDIEIQDGGSVYNLENIIIRTPKNHYIKTYNR